MSYAIKIGTIEARWIDNEPTPAGCVRYNGEFPEYPIWDNLLNNIRAMTQAEIDALPALRLAEMRTALPDYALLADQAQGALDTNNAYLGFADTATNAQVRTQVKALTQQNNRIIKVLLKVVQDTLSS
jgi:hypothetical protein